MIKIGAHISVAGGLSKGALRAKSIGVECMQIFGGSPRRYDILVPHKDELRKYKQIIQENAIFPVFVHASYLLNLASSDQVLRHKSIISLSDSLSFADTIEAYGVIYHPGSPKGGDKIKAIKREARSVKEVLSLYKGTVFLVLENTAGKKKIGVNCEEIGLLMKEISDPRVKICIDTAHSLESGDIKEFSPPEIEKWADRWEKDVGLSNIIVLHINDSKTKYNSQSDRHANIGEGVIGIKGFQCLAESAFFSQIPWILEVPGFDGKGPDKKNVDILKAVFIN